MSLANINKPSSRVRIRKGCEMFPRRDSIGSFAPLLVWIETDLINKLYSLNFFKFEKITEAGAILQKKGGHLKI